MLDAAREPCSPLWTAALAAVPAVFVVLVFALPQNQTTCTICTFPDIELGALAKLVRVHSREQPLAPDGRLDVYAMLRRDHEPDAVVEACHGPSRDDVAAGDYTNFPYQRRRGRFAPDAEPAVPILWERNGAYRYVAFSDGSTRMLTQAEAAALFRDDPGQE